MQRKTFRGSALCESPQQSPSLIPAERGVGGVAILTAVQNAPNPTHSSALVTHTHTLLSWCGPASEATVLCLRSAGTSCSFSPPRCVASISCVATSRTCGDISAVRSRGEDTRCHFTPHIRYRRAYITVLCLVGLYVFENCEKKTHIVHKMEKLCGRGHILFVISSGKYD